MQSSKLKESSPTVNFWGTQTGVSLAETLMIILALGFIVLLLSNLPNSMNLINKSKHLSLAREIATKQIENRRAIKYINLVPEESTISATVDPRISLLPNGSGTVVVKDCDAAICTNDERIKQVAVTVNWTENSKTQKVNLKTFIGEGGLNQ